MSLWTALPVVGKDCLVQNGPDLFVIVVLVVPELLQSVE